MQIQNIKMTNIQLQETRNIKEKSPSSLPIIYEINSNQYISFNFYFVSFFFKIIFPFYGKDKEIDEQIKSIIVHFSWHSKDTSTKYLQEFGVKIQQQTSGQQMIDNIQNIFSFVFLILDLKDSQSLQEYRKKYFFQDLIINPNHILKYNLINFLKNKHDYEVKLVLCCLKIIFQRTQENKNFKDYILSIKEEFEWAVYFLKKIQSGAVTTYMFYSADKDKEMEKQDAISTLEIMKILQIKGSYEKNQQIGKDKEIGNQQKQINNVNDDLKNLNKEINLVDQNDDEYDINNDCYKIKKKEESQQPIEEEEQQEYNTNDDQEDKNNQNQDNNAIFEEKN
ncbi:hypothetical protein PPERSA_06407 [Pseudocohnilembus persalinus]|uniref:Uncharacterized protein n=1 Tax=Pseudocohnilembus persalinus TaxID=266149 RepID=A0A0V0QS92_PSEPJ|nr:hypothetical protein PPERSA_06407 [Pseudocohnilembus persalinus]|eukprot:KRX04773.1 hypothetical protein PPERSA_06407 [Pseudocohnilembus persalinus]